MGRRPKSADIRQLILETSLANPLWGAPREIGHPSYEEVSIRTLHDFHLAQFGPSSDMGPTGGYEKIGFRMQHQRPQQNIFEALEAFVHRAFWKFNSKLT
jgi:hypothetical protein